MAKRQVRAGVFVQRGFLVYVGKVNFQFVFIEERFSVDRGTGKHVVVHNSFDDVCKAMIERGLLHGQREKLKSERGAAFGIRFEIGQVVSHGKCFALCSRADSAGYIHFTVSDIVKKFKASFVQTFVARLYVRFAHCGVQVYCADGVSFRLFEIAYGRVALVVGFVEFVVPGFAASSALVNKEHGKIEILLVRGVIVHF